MEISEVLKSHEMDEGQKRLLDLMKHFDSLCQKYGIHYFLGGGSALGAVRHRGFLPWDDDVDLYIPRKEYEKIYKLRDEFFSEDFVLVCNEEFETYRNTLVRCIDTNSTAITKARIVDDAPKGQFIELFILDPMPRDAQEQNMWLKKHWIYSELLCSTFRVANERISDWLDWDLYNEYRLRYEKEGRQKILKELHDELFSVDEETADEYCLRWGLRNIIYDIDWFSEQRYVPFEETKLPVAFGVENVLRVDYGDTWMYIPVQDEKIVHTITSSMTIPYRRFMDDYLQFFNPKEVLESYTPRKDASVKWFETKYNCMLKAQELKQLAISVEMKSISTEQARTLLTEKKYDDVQKMYENWYNEQVSEAFWQYRKYLNIGDDNLFCALMPYLKQGRYSLVSKIINWRKKSRGSLSKELTKMEIYVKQIRKAYQNAELKQWNEMKRNMPDERIMENQYDYEYLHLLSDVKNSDGSDVSSLLEKEKWLENIFPENGELLSLKGDIKHLASQNDEATQLWLSAFENTRNGLVRLHIKDMMNKMGVAQK